VAKIKKRKEYCSLGYIYFRSSFLAILLPSVIFIFATVDIYNVYFFIVCSKQNVFVEWLTLIHIRESRVQISAQSPAILTEGFRGFP
jgi:hypothetical protein